MKSRQLFFSITIVLLSALALYLLIAYHLLQDPKTPKSGIVTVPPAAEALEDETAPAEPTEVAITAHQSANDSGLVSGGRKLLEIFGRVTDNDNRPIENALITEERYFASSRSDNNGTYRLLLDLPRHRYPTLHFLRNGYDGQRIRLGKKELQSSLIYELDVSLANALDSVNLQGWVGNEIGIGLEGARVELAASYTRNRESFYLTEFTDSNGNFEFEGVRSGETYKFSIHQTPEYTYHEDPDFLVTQNPGAINIVLRKLNFVDIDGMIVDRRSTPVPNYEMYVSNVTTGMHTRKIVSDSSGFFTLHNFPPGELNLTTRGSEFFRISGLQLNDYSFQNLQLVVDRGSHYLSGWVSDENGVAVEKAMVTLDRKFIDGKVEHSSYRSQRTDRNGGFAFANLGDGSYHVTVYAIGYEKQDFSHLFDAQSGEIFITLKRD
ncbi:MAG: carboxypeptidase regulatory-like domain-containing protein [Gammaproteobacteria bacterium]|nr:MAG: carboxypeptidase regulatory-like domain-containing protein [Gammaproteobacteria bacterium]